MILSIRPCSMYQGYSSEQNRKLLPSRSSQCSYSIPTTVRAAVLHNSTGASQVLVCVNIAPRAVQGTASSVLRSAPVYDASFGFLSKLISYKASYLPCSNNCQSAVPSFKENIRASPTEWKITLCLLLDYLY